MFGRLLFSEELLGFLLIQLRCPLITTELKRVDAEQDVSLVTVHLLKKCRYLVDWAVRGVPVDLNVKCVVQSLSRSPALLNLAQPIWGGCLQGFHNSRLEWSVYELGLKLQLIACCLLVTISDGLHVDFLSGFEVTLGDRLQQGCRWLRLQLMLCCWVDICCWGSCICSWLFDRRSDLWA